MIAVVISFPGHFLLTKLTIESLVHQYNNIEKIYIVYDDNLSDGWPNYVDDASAFYCMSKKNFISFGEIDQNIPTCAMGWYRQQLVKCCIDKFFIGDQWFVVDGDVIFDDAIDLKNITPVDIRPEFSAESTQPLSLAVINCVKTMLDIETHPLLSDGQYKITSSIPFRILERPTLEYLRQRVEQYLGGDFVEKITEFCRDQKLLVNDDTGNQMVMHEWELIEAVNHMLYPDRFRIKHIGSGYEHLKHTSNLSPGYRFRQGFMYDYQVHRPWFEAQLSEPITESTWNKVEHFGKYIEHIQNQPL